MHNYPLNRYVPGTYKDTCARCGFDYLHSELIFEERTRSYVCSKCYDPPHPQDVRNKKPKSSFLDSIFVGGSGYSEGQVDSLSLLGSGSFTRDGGVKWSLANGYAFIDLGSADSFIPYINDKLIISDTAGKKAIGYIKGAGIAETLGSELITGWTNASFETLESTGADITSAINSDIVGVVRSNECTINKGYQYKIVANLTLNSGEAPDLTLRAVLEGLLITTELSEGVNTYYRIGYNTTFTDCKATLQVGGASDFACSLSCKQLLTPYSTGVTIVSAKGGEIFNWLIETGFNYYDNTGYTYEIYG